MLILCLEFDGPWVSIAVFTSSANFLIILSLSVIYAVCSFAVTFKVFKILKELKFSVILEEF